MVLSWRFVTLHIMCCDVAGSVGSREHWLRDISRKRKEFQLLSIVLRILQLLIIILEPLVRFRWSYQQIVPLQISTALQMSHIRLQTDFLDPFTYTSSPKSIISFSTITNLITAKLWNCWHENCSCSPRDFKLEHLYHRFLEAFSCNLVLCENIFSRPVKQNCRQYNDKTDRTIGK